MRTNIELRSFTRSWDNRGTPKIWELPVYAHAPFSPKFLIGFCSHGHSEYTVSAKFDDRSFIHSWDNRGYFKNFGSPWIRPRSLFSQIFKGPLFPWTVRIYLPNLEFVALSVPEILGGTQKIWAVPVYAHAPFSPKFVISFCSHGLSEYICQIWRSYLYPFLR